MNPTLIVTLSACAVVVAVAGVAVAVLAHRGLRSELEAVRLELSALQARVDRLRPVPGDQRSDGPERLPDEDEFVITTLATPAQASGLVGPDAVDDRRLSGAEVVSVAVGESLVRVVSLAYGIRRALSPQNRNRIAFEMRREVKRSRKQRRRDVREAQRDVRLRRQPDETRRDAA